MHEIKMIAWSTAPLWVPLALMAVALVVKGEW